MSFNLEVNTGSVADARQIIAEECLPDSVELFIVQALHGLTPSAGVYIKAVGHLWDGLGSCAVSTATLEVRALTLRKPKANVD